MGMKTVTKSQEPADGLIAVQALELVRDVAERGIAEPGLGGPQLPHKAPRRISHLREAALKNFDTTCTRALEACYECLILQVQARLMWLAR